MNILITGGTGFIGSRLALKCREKGFSVRCFGQRNTEAESENSRELEQRGVELVFGSILDERELAQAVKGIDLVVHLAAAQHEANVPDQHFWDVNVHGTQRLLEACVSAGVKRFVHGSTIGVYGDASRPIDETSTCRPENIYGVTKLEGERLALTYRDRIELVVIRISETYGPGDRRLLKLFKAIQKKRFFKIGNSRNLHQLMYVDDLVDGILKAAETTAGLGEIILLVGSRALTTEEMVETIADELKVKLPAFRLPIYPFTALAFLLEILLRPLGIQPPLHRRRMDFFRKSFSFLTAKARDLLGFAPQYSFQQGVAETARWYRSQGWLKAAGGNGHHGLSADSLVDRTLAAQIEPFDTFWEAPQDIEKGYASFGKFYKRNYGKYLPADKHARTLVISCGAGYLLELLRNLGYTDAVGIDSDPAKIAHATNRGLKCQAANAFPFLRTNTVPFDLIFAEQEINHLAKKEILEFLDLCRRNLTEGGTLFVHSLNGANPLTGSEALAQNFNHFNTLTEYSLRQVLQHTGFGDIIVFPLNLYIFYENPINYVGMGLNAALTILFRLGFIFYGKDNKLFSKKIAAVCQANPE
jgi:nucleoside-diphosphate-sugar epimerase/2-polyprenyl-3-methyl-5-hydroxy-6-metoxy-1,4-benzoquinol methylase